MPTSIKQRFRSAIRRGTGEAYLLIKQYPEFDFSAEIINASLFNYAYDGQCEYSRAFYLFGLAELSQQKNDIRESILNTLNKAEDGTWTLAQLFDLALCYAKKEDKEAYRSIYDTFEHNIIHCSCWTGGTEILELDGLEGMFHIADKVGSHLKTHTNESEDDFLISHCQQLHEELDVYKELETKAQENSNIRYYLDKVKETMNCREVESAKKESYANIIEEIVKRKIIYLKNRKLTESERLLIADKFLLEKDKLVKAKFLHVFKDIKYPYDYKVLLNLAKQKNNKYRLKEYAIDALSNIQSDEIRGFALEKIQSSRYPAIYIRILLSNYQEGDEKLLTTTAEKFKNEHIIESLASCYIDIFQANQTRGCQIPLEVLYNKSNCGICRYYIVKILIENNVLSSSINNEIQFDCNEDTRNLHQNLSTIRVD